MIRPPKTPPHSDLDGIHEDERPNVESAVKTGQDSGDLALAQEKSIGRPPHTGDEEDDSEDRDDGTD